MHEHMLTRVPYSCPYSYVLICLYLNEMKSQSSQFAETLVSAQTECPMFHPQSVHVLSGAYCRLVLQV